MALHDDPTFTAAEVAGVTIHPPRGSGCIHRRTVEAGKFCSPDCDKCPRLGAKECLFGKKPYSIIDCDSCAKYGAPGCVFSKEGLPPGIKPGGPGCGGGAAGGAGGPTSTAAVGPPSGVPESRKC